MSNETVDKRKGYLRYGVILALIVAIRIFEVNTAGAAWRTLDSRWWLALFALAFVVSLATCLYTRRFFAPLTVVCLSGLAGATTTIVANSIPGMIIGGTVGVFAVFDVMQRFSLRVLTFVALYLLPAVLLGLGVGYFGAKWNWLRVEPARELQTAAIVISLLCVVGIAWTVLLSLWRKQKPIHLLWKIPMFLVIATVAEPSGVTLDTFRRSNLLSANDTWVSGIGPVTLLPTKPKDFTQGFYTLQRLSTLDGLSSKMGQELRDMRTIATVDVQPTPTKYANNFHNAGFEVADFRNVTELRIGANRDFDDEGLKAFRNCETMGVVRIYGGESAITDKGLVALGNMKALHTLWLEGASISGSGLKHLHPSAPLTDVSLSNTNVDDEAMKHLGKYSLSTLRLRGTCVTGTGLRHLDDNLQSGIAMLDLAGSQFQEANVPLLPQSLNYLDLEGTRLTKTGVTAFAERFSKGFTSLLIAETGIDDESVAELARLKLATLRIDASQLTIKSAAVLAAVPDLQLAYEAESWLTSGRSITDLFAHHETLDKAILKARMRAKGVPSQYAVSIDNLVVTAEMVEPLNRIPNCDLQHVRINGQQDAGLQDVEPSDLYRWFPKVQVE